MNTYKKKKCCYTSFKMSKYACIVLIYDNNSAIF